MLPALLRILGLLSVLLSAGTRDAQGDGDGFEAAQARWRASKSRPSLFVRTRARQLLAATGDARALTLLVKDYDKPEEPMDEVRYLVVTLCGRHLGREQDTLPAWTAWRRRHAAAGDAWLWYVSAWVEHGLGGAEAAEAVGEPDADPFLRAASLRGLFDGAEARGADVPPRLDAVRSALARLPSALPARGVLAEAAAMALAAGSEPWATEEGALLLEQVIRLLEDRVLTARSKLVIARCLARAFGTEGADLSAAVWRRELAAARAGAQRTEAPSDRYAGPEFFGLRASGRRIVYVIDLSDSMLAPLGGAERDALQRPVTPTPGGPAPKAPPADGLPWDRIRTRFDAARECLKASLQKLDKERSFCVILFGDVAEPLASTPGFVPVTPKTVRASIQALDDIAPRSTATDALHPYGRLRGRTNLHGGLRRAFRAQEQGFVARGEHVDARLLEQGCDTVYLLSDGVPSWDDFAAIDVRDPEDQTGDPESRVPLPNTREIHYMGPYGWGTERGDLVAADVRRMNLFRNAEIHVVAIGEADAQLLRAIAAVGHGRVRFVGQGAPSEAAPR